MPEAEENDRKTTNSTTTATAHTTTTTTSTSTNAAAMLPLSERVEFAPSATDYARWPSLHEHEIDNASHASTTTSTTSRWTTDGVDVIFGGNTNTSNHSPPRLSSLLPGDHHSKRSRSPSKLSGGSDSNSNGNNKRKAHKTPRTNFRLWMQMQTGRLIHHVYFKRSVVGTILLTSALLGLSTREYNVANDDASNNTAFDRLVESLLQLLLYAFYTEFGLRCLHYQGRAMFSQPWLGWDALVVVATLVWRPHGVWACPTPLALRGLRMLRSFRKASGVTHALAQLAHTMLRVGSSVVSLTFLLAWVVYIFAVLLVRLTREQPTLQNYNTEAFDDDTTTTTLENQNAAFASLGHAVWTLAQFLTGNLLPSDNDNNNEQSNGSANFYTGASLTLFWMLTTTVGGLWVAVCVDALQKVHQERVQIVEPPPPQHNPRVVGVGGVGVGHGNDETTRKTNAAAVSPSPQLLAESIEQVLQLQRALQHSMERIEELQRNQQQQQRQSPPLP